MAQKLRVITIVLLLFIVLSGCAPVSVPELYSLPQLPEEYISLQSLIDAEIDSGSEYSSPVRGSYRQSVQLYDLNGNGQSEALAFFRASDGALKICIYQFENSNYVPVCSIIGEGSSIGRIEYADMDGDGVIELVVAWQMDGGISMLNVYSLNGWSGSVLLTADCYGFTMADMENSGKTDLLLLRYDLDKQGFIEMYSMDDSHEMLSSSSLLSRGFDSVARLRSGKLSDGSIALFAEGSYMENRTITDVLIADSGELHNISAGESGVSPTTRSYEVYSEDIDGDGILEIPSTRKLVPQNETSTDYWLFDWSKMHPNGSTEFCITTFHCYADGWYLELPDKLSKSTSIRREDSDAAGMSIVISSINGEEVTDLLAIYTLTGENRHERANIGGRIVLAEDETTVYALRLYSAELSADEISKCFHLIHTEWINPVM